MCTWLLNSSEEFPGQILAQLLNHLDLLCCHAPGAFQRFPFLGGVSALLTHLGLHLLDLLTVRHPEALSLPTQGLE